MLRRHAGGEALREAGEVGPRRAVVLELVVVPDALDRLRQDLAVGERLVAGLAQVLREVEDVAVDRGQEALVVVLLAVGGEEFLEVIEHAGEALGIIAQMGEGLGLHLLLVVLDQVLPGVAHDVGDPEKHHADGAALDQIVELALVVAHDHRAAVDQRHRGIGGKRHRTLVHHRDFGRHALDLTHPLSDSMSQSGADWEAARKDGYYGRIAIGRAPCTSHSI